MNCSNLRAVSTKKSPPHNLEKTVAAIKSDSKISFQLASIFTIILLILVEHWTGNPLLPQPAKFASNFSSFCIITQLIIIGYPKIICFECAAIFAVVLTVLTGQLTSNPLLFCPKTSSNLLRICFEIMVKNG